MREIELHPHWRSCPINQVIDELGYEAFSNLIPVTAAYYKSALSLPAVLEYYGAGDVIPDEDNAYVTCKLASHGSSDMHASARYFRVSKDTGEFDPTFYCFKCQKAYSSFWFTYSMERDWRGRNLRDTIKFINSEFHIPPPLELWFQYDSSIFYSEDGRGVVVDPILPFLEVDKILELKKINIPLYLKGLKRILSGRV
jgi:hypothetical protein